MGSNSQKTPFSRSLNRFAEKKVLDAIQTLGKALPCKVTAVSGSIVTVSFEILSGFTLPNVTMPHFGPEYVRYPTQIGDLGMTMSADAYIGGISALGGGIADLALPANLSALIFVPIASKNWPASENPNAVVIYGPDGAIIRDTGKNANVIVDSSGNVQAWGKRSWSWDAGGYGERYTNDGAGNITIDTYFIGASVTTIPHAYHPPKIPAP